MYFLKLWSIAQLENIILYYRYTKFWIWAIKCKDSFFIQRAWWNQEKKIVVLIKKIKKITLSLKQASWQWYQRFNSFMITLDFRRCSYDSCVYFKITKDWYFIYLLLNVDDMFIATKCKDEINKIRSMLNKEFKIKDMGVL